jgi:hypothetical protein
MGDQNLRVRPWTGDGYGDLITYPKYAKYRMEPNYPGATGDANTTMVVYERDETADNGERELGRHELDKSLVAFANQPDPTPPSEVDATEGASDTANKAKATNTTSTTKK